MIINLIGEWPPELAAAASAVAEQAQAAHAVNLPTGDVNLKLVDAIESQELNKRYSGNAYATDVLTFNYHDDDEQTATSADIVICADVAQEQAKTAGNGLADEVALLVAHGVLHAAGSDHDTLAARKAMERAQQEWVQAAGYRYRDLKWE